MLDGEVTSLALCWRLEGSDGAGIALTSHDVPLSSEGIRFDPTPGMTPAAVTRSLGLEPHSGEASGALSADALTEQDLALGRWDGAGIRLTVIDWQDGERPQLQLLAGELGAVSISGQEFSAELRGAAAALSRPVCPATSPECRAEFGDRKCRVDLANRTMRARVTASDGASLTLDSTVDERFVLGRLRYLGSDNCGLTAVVLAASGNTVELREAPRDEVEAGCAIELREGCDKQLATCTSRFANAANFRGEPHLPGMDLLTRYPGA